jgi:hypothetical protein
VPSTCLTGADSSWVFAQVNVLVCFLVSRLVVVSSLECFGAQEVGLVDLGFPGLNRSWLMQELSVEVFKFTSGGQTQGPG